MAAAELTLLSVVRRHREPVAVDVDETVVMMSIERANYYSLDGVGARIWQLLDAPLTVSDLVAALQAEFDVAPDQCRNDVLDFLRTLLAEGLIETVE